jgi:hypothetical protein
LAGGGRGPPHVLGPRGLAPGWPGWHKVSVRKPLAVLAAVWCLALPTMAWVTGRDIPPGAVSVLLAVAPSCVLGYCGSSAYEAARAPREEDKDG